MRDAIGRSWQLSTIQYDFNMNERFELEYVGADNARHRPIMLHRALFGSVERFFGVLLEHYAGNFPTWLAPVQVRVLPVATAHEEYAEKVADRVRAAGGRVDVVGAGEPLGKRIRAAKLEKLPYILVVGDDDVAAGTVGVNARGSDQPERGVDLAEFVERFADEVQAADRRERCRPDCSARAAVERLARATYVTSGGAAGGVGADDVASGRGSVFTRILHSGLPDVDTHIVHRGAHCFAILNAFPYSVGHLLVLPYREVGDLEALDPEEAAELWATVTDAVVAIKARLPPRGHQRRCQPRPAGRRQRQRAPARPRRAPLDRRRQLHDGDRQHAHAARGPSRQRRQAPRRMADDGDGVAGSRRRRSRWWRVARIVFWRWRWSRWRSRSCRTGGGTRTRRSCSTRRGRTPRASRWPATSCYSCHSNETDWPRYSYVAPMSWLVRSDVERGRDELNFSDWERDSGEADDAVEVIEAGSMPPGRYTLMHREATLTAEERDVLVGALAGDVGPTDRISRRRWRDARRALRSRRPPPG